MISEEQKALIVEEVTKKTSKSVKRNIWLSMLTQTGMVLGFIWTVIQLGGYGFGVGQQWEAVKGLPPKVAALEHSMQSLDAAVQRIGDRQQRGTKTLKELSKVADDIKQSHTTKL